MKSSLITSTLLIASVYTNTEPTVAFTPQQCSSTSTCSRIISNGRSSLLNNGRQNNNKKILPLLLSDDDENINTNEEAENFKSKAEELREQIRKMEEQLQSSSPQRRSNNNSEYIKTTSNDDSQPQQGKSLKNKRILVIGANGRLGSMVTRYLLRSHPEVKEVVAAVHYVGQATTRGYGRLSYEVGAEDGVGTIGAAWSPEEERNARFEFSDDMKSYNLQNLVRKQKFKDQK